MTVLTVTNLPAATHGETVRCLFAIELSRMSWVIAFNTPLSEKISHRTLTGCKWKRLLELIEEVRARVSREMGRAVEVVSCYEAGYDGFWLHRQLEAHGIRNYVIDPASLQVDRRARRVKTDRIDTERLLRSLMAYLRGEPKVWSVVRVPSVAEEDARRLHRERDRLVFTAGPFALAWLNDTAGAPTRRVSAVRYYRQAPSNDGVRARGTTIHARALANNTLAMEHEDAEQTRCGSRCCGNSDRCRLCTAEADDRRGVAGAVADISDFATGRFHGNELV